MVDSSGKGLDEANKLLSSRKRKPLPRWPYEFEDAKFDKADPENKFLVDMLRHAEPLSTFMRECRTRKIDKQLALLRCEKFTENEIIAARLYTGPMFVKCASRPLTRTQPVAARPTHSQSTTRNAYPLSFGCHR